MTVDAESNELASERRCKVSRMIIPASNGVRYLWNGSVIIVCSRADALVEESLVHK